MNKNYLSFFISFFILATVLISQPLFAAAPPVEMTIAPILKKVLPAVVNIRAQIKVTDLSVLQELQKRNQNKEGQPNPSAPNDTFVSVGSGVVVDANNGYILTNAHVVNDAQAIVVTLGDRRHFNAKVIGSDTSSDIAVLQIKTKNLTAISFGDSSKLETGDFVAAIGNPFGLSQSVSSGIVSARDRATLGIERYENFIQTDAPINPGNSGGALINMRGELIGINTAIFAPNQGSVGIGFAIPSNMAKVVMMQLIQFGSVKRGALGITAQDITPELADAFHLSVATGAVISEVFPASPAQKAGLAVGDILMNINGFPIKTANDVVTTIGFLRVDSQVNIAILRNNKPMNFSIVLMDPKKRDQLLQQADPFLYGVGLKNMNVFNPGHGRVQGVQVMVVQEGTNAWQSDLQTGDVILSANGQRVIKMDDLKAISQRPAETLVLNVLRGAGAIFLVISKAS